MKNYKISQVPVEGKLSTKRYTTERPFAYARYRRLFVSGVQLSTYVPTGEEVPDSVEIEVLNSRGEVSPWIWVVLPIEDARALRDALNALLEGVQE